MRKLQSCRILYNEQDLEQDQRKKRLTDTSLASILYLRFYTVRANFKIIFKDNFHERETNTKRPLKRKAKSYGAIQKRNCMYENHFCTMLHISE